MSSRRCRTAPPIPTACSDKPGSHRPHRLARDQRAYCPTGQAARDGIVLACGPWVKELRLTRFVDPTRFDFYAMDCYRHVVGTLVNEKIQASNDFDGTERRNRDVGVP